MSRSAIERSIRHGFLDRRTSTSERYTPMLIANQGTATMSRAISAELRRARSFVLSVAFITPGALNVLKQDLLDFKGQGLIITSNYLGFNTPATYRELLNFPGLEVRVMPASTGFHAKGYVFRGNGHVTALIGSSNLTVSALSSNHEWNFRFSSHADGHVIEQLEQAIHDQCRIADKLDQVWLERFEMEYEPGLRQTWFDRRAEHTVDKIVPVPPGLDDAQAVTIAANRRAGSRSHEIRLNRMQQQALRALDQLRGEEATKALVVSATGTGKTILSALDIRRFSPERFLFLAHREQILDKALQEYQAVLGEPTQLYGKLAGSSKQMGREFKYVFATTNSFVRAIRNGDVAPRDFDYVLIDEVHRAGASTYIEIIQFLKPKFLLGMTATPERTDGFNVFELFDHNLAFEIRLQSALEEDMLAPFHYFGVTDYTTASGETIDDLSDLRHLVSNERADHLVAKLAQYGHAWDTPRGLIFCSRNDEARALSDLLNRRELHGLPLRTRAVSGADSIEYREASVRELEAGKLDYILSVDIFNEGIDIPSLNQVVMMRQTESSIVFTQQLGRGLRLHPNKDYLVVIDFIGNYANNYLIPTALFGDTSHNKDQLRRKMIDVRGDHVIAGVASINFDEIARERVFAALGAAKLDSLTNLRQAYQALRARLGRIPYLLDFAKHDTIDPVVIGTRYDHYAALVQKIEGANGAETLDTAASGMLTLLSREFLNGKRPQELLLLRELVRRNGPVTEEEFRTLLTDMELDASEPLFTSLKRILSLEWFTAAERSKYARCPLVSFDGVCFHLSKPWRQAWDTSAAFRQYSMDAIETGIYIAEHRWGFADQLKLGERYTRKDACRLLNWRRNEQATIYGYKVDRESGTCPIFVTYHKADDVTESTRYEDEFLDPQTMLWYTRSRLNLASAEVQAIVNREVRPMLFVKKDDAEGRDFIYLGEVVPHGAAQTTMPGANGVPLPVVTMMLELPQPVDAATYEYLTG